MLLKPTLSTITLIILIHRTTTTNKMWDFLWEMNFQMILMEQISQSLCINLLLWLSSHGLLSSCPHGPASSQITLFTILGKRELCPLCSEESTLWEDTQLVKKDALLVNFVRLHALLSLLSSNLSQDLMDQEELQNMISIWLNASSAVSAKKLALLVLLLKDLISNTQHSSMRSSFTISLNFLKTEINGSHNLQELWKLKQEQDESSG